MKFLKKLYIKGFLNDFKQRLLGKTSYYDKYYIVSDKVNKNEIYNYDKDFIDQNIVINENIINKMTDTEIDELYDILKNEETYLN